MAKPFDLHDYALWRIECLLIHLNRKVAQMALTLDDLVTKVQAESTVADSAIALLENLSAMLTAAIAAGDPTKIQAIADSIDAESAKLAAAVTANTPAAPPATS